VNREFPADMAYNADTTRPATPLEALMQAAPGEEPRTSSVELLDLREAIQDALESAVTAEEAWVFNALVVERMSLRHLGRQLNRPKTTIARIRDRAIAKLQTRLLQDPAIRDRLGITHTEDE
jgi:hypothetical protein